MILFLMRRHLTPLVMAVSFGAAVVLAFTPAFIGLSIALPLLVGMTRFTGLRPTLFEAALPISLRDLVVARLYASAALLWLPLGTCIIATMVRGDDVLTVPMIVNVAPVLSLAVFAPSVIRAGQLNGLGGRVVALPLLAVVVLGAVAIYLLPALVTSTLLVIAIGSTVFAVFTTAPATLQSAPARPARAPVVRASGAKPAARGAAGWWWPALHSATSPMTAVSFVVMIMYGVIAPTLPLLYVVIFISPIILAVRRQTRWMYGLPLSHRSLLLANLAPMLLAIPSGLLLGNALPFPRDYFEDITVGAPKRPPTLRYYSTAPTSRSSSGTERATGGFPLSRRPGENGRLCMPVACSV